MTTARLRNIALLALAVAPGARCAREGTLDSSYGVGGAALIGDGASEMFDVLHGDWRSDRSVGRESVLLGRIFVPIGLQHIVITRVDDAGRPDPDLGPGGSSYGVAPFPS